MVTENSKVEFYELRFGSFADKHNLFGVVRSDTDDSLKIDRDVMAIILFLRLNKTIKEVAKIINFSPQVVITVLKMLENANFIKSIDHVAIKDNSNKIKPWLDGVPHKWFKWILYKPLVVSVLIFGILGTILGILINGLPTYKAFFWTSDIFVVFVSLSLVDIPMMFFHESCHFIATKAAGAEAVMRINYRYIFIVAETESYHLAIVPKKYRYIIYFAGMIGDLFITAILFLILTMTKIYGIHIGLWYNFLTAIILMELLGIIWEFDVFLETDMYNFLSEYLGFENLRNDALKYIDLHAEKWKKIVFFPIKRLLKFISKDFSENSDDLRLLSKNDEKKLFLYILILVGGLVVITWENIFYSIPRDLTYIYQSVVDANKALRTSDLLLLLKSVVIILLIIFDYLLLFFLWLRKNKIMRKRRQRIFRH